MHDKVGEVASVRQLTLDFSEGFFVAEPPSAAARNITRTIVFPKHIDIPHFGRFQRQVNVLFAPLGISVEFRLTRQKRLEMKWIFPPEKQTAPVASPEFSQAAVSPASPELSQEELKAFQSVVFSLAGAQ
ncbi:MAG: hypothetical protein VXW11_06740 [Pseudomonadota bacterium]|nr:hypothetical protein [Pseudomonadota bacterium]